MTYQKSTVILNASEISHDQSDKEYTLRKTTLPGVCSLDIDAKTIKQPVIASVSVAIPVSKACGIYSVLYSDGLPRSLYSLAMTMSY